MGISNTGSYGKDHRLKRLEFYNKYSNTPLYSYEFMHSYFNSNNIVNSGLMFKRLRLDRLRKIKDGIFEDHRFEYVTDNLPSRGSLYQDLWGYPITDGREMHSRVPEIEYYSPSTKYTEIYRGSDRSVDPIGVLSGSLKKIIYPTKGATVFNMEANQALGEDKFFIDKKDYFLSFDQTDSNTTVFLDMDFTSDHIGAHHYTFSLKETFRNHEPGMPIYWIEEALNNTPIQVRIRNTNNTWSKTIFSGTYEYFKSLWRISAFDESVPNAGRYRLEVILGNFGFYPIGLEGSVEFRSIGQNHASKYVGGLRAKSIQYFDANEQLLLEKNYKYTLANGKSSGRIGNVPNYNYYTNTLYFFKDRKFLPPLYLGKEDWYIRSSYSTLDFGFTSNIPVLYTNVEETIKNVQQGNNASYGSILYEFHPLLYYPHNNSFVYPFAPGLVDVWLSGKPQKATYYNQLGTAVMAKEYEYDYEFLEVDLEQHRSLKVGVIGKDNIESLGYLGPSNIDQYSVYSLYPYTGYSRLKKETTTTYFGHLGSIEESVEYTYDAKKQLKQEKLVDGQGETTTSSSYYAYDYPNIPAYQSLVGANRIATAIQKDVVKGSSSRTREFKNYNIQNNKPKLEGIYLNYDTGSSAADVNPSTLDATYKARVKILSYDSYDNPLEVKDAHGTPSVYLWGYAGQKLIAKIDNATYAEVLSGLASSGKSANTVLAAFDKTNVADHDIHTAISGLRSYLPKAKATSFTYRPLLGVTSITDARGEKLTYEYDKLGRLQRIVDLDGKTVQSYCYNFAGQQVDCLTQ